LSALLVIFQVIFLCRLSSAASYANTKISHSVFTVDESDPSTDPLLCGSTTTIMSRILSNRCMEASPPNDIVWRRCDESNPKQQWIFHCCDPTNVRCGDQNPHLKPLQDSFTYDYYMQIQNVDTNLCISSNEEWTNGRDNEQVLVQECQPSFDFATDSGRSDSRIQRDKWAFSSWDRIGDSVLTSHFIQIINLKCPGCLGPSNDKNKVEGLSCNTGLQREEKYQFKVKPIAESIKSDL